MNINQKVSVLFAALLLTSIYCVQPYQQGEQIYTANCENCHQADGNGLRGLIPPLNKADYLERNNDLACIIRYGMKGEVVVNGKSYNQEMPGNTALTEAEISNLINYIHQAWDNELKPTNITEVKEILESCEK